MAIRVIPNDYDGVSVDVNSDIWIIPATSLLAHTESAFTFGAFDYGTLVIDGTVVAGADGVTSSADSDGNTVTVSQTGSVTGQSDGIQLHGDLSLIHI